MIVIPAIDLREGCVVQLVGGDFTKEAVRLENPHEVAQRWTGLGFSRLHIVDLDAATGRGSNAAIVRELLRDATVQIQVGGGVRTTDQVTELFDAGATSVVVGTRALEDRDWLDDMAHQHPFGILVAADVRERRVVTHGWARDSRRLILDVIEDLDGLPLAGLLVTAVHREGQMKGTDLPLMEAVAEANYWPVHASGGIASLADLRSLEDRRIAGAVLGMALYTGAIAPHILVEEFAQ